MSLLFTPASQRGGGLGGEGGKPTPGEFRGMPSFGRSPGHGRKEPTSTRRRSLTPASQPKDTPPPPPGDSLLDSPVGLAPAPWGTPRLEDGGEG